MSRGEGSVGRKGRGAAGFVNTVHISHLVPNGEARWEISDVMQLGAAIEEDFLDLVEGLESEFSRLYSAQTVDSGGDRTPLGGSTDGRPNGDTTGRTTFQNWLCWWTVRAELFSTSYGNGGSPPHPKTSIGPGKVQDLALLVQDVGANMVVFRPGIISGSSADVGAGSWGVRVVDRTEVILDIFAQRARTRAGKLQVELAQLEYLMPRLVGRGRAMSRLGGGIGNARSG